MYTETFKNTFLLDVLEFVNLVKIPEAVKSSSDDSSSGLQNSISKTDVDLEVASHETLDVSSDSASKTGNVNDAVVTVEGENTSSQMKNNVVTEEKDPFLVEWDGPDDKENPWNWSTSKKAIMIAQVMALTTVTYMGSSIYTPGQLEIQKDFKVGHVVATLNLSLYVLGYGIGPIIFSPLSEFALLGRQQIYILTLFAFALFQIGAATVNNIGGLVVIRFFSGIFCSPALATGGATISDIVKPEIVPVFLGLWAIGAVAAPVIAPLIGAAILDARGWRWIFWLLLWLCALTLIILVCFFPETHHENILYRRAKRLRKITGDNRYYTKQSKKELNMDFKKFALTAITKPVKMIAQEPIILAFDGYIALCYGVFYLFFEAFPLVFVGIYHFTLVEVGLAYMGFQVGCCISYPIFLFFLMKYLVPRFKNNTFVPEDFLVLAMSVCWALPLSLFLFGWAAAVHWILPIIAEVFFVINVFNLFQVTFAYLAMCYPDHVASVFAGNGLCRAGFACAFPLFGQAMYDNLSIKGYPVAWGSSLLGFVAIGMATIPFAIYKYGATLRSKSKFKSFADTESDEKAQNEETVSIEKELVEEQPESLTSIQQEQQ